MRHAIRRRLLGAVLGAFSLPVFAPAVLAEDTCLSLERSLSLAIARAPEVDAARAVVDEAEAGLREAESLNRPQVSSFGRTASGDSGLTTNQQDNQLGLRVSQRLWDFGDARLARDAARGQIQQSESGVQQQQVLAAGIVAEAYLAKLEAEAMIGVISERRDYFRRQQDSVDSLLSRGGATRAESAQIAAQLAQAEADVLELGFLVERSSTRIAEYTGMTPDLCGAELAGRAMDRALHGLDTIEAVVSASLADNPQIAARRGAVRSLEAQSMRERRSRLPVVNLVGIVSYVYDDARDDWDTRDRLGVDVSVPLFTGDALGARQDRVRARLVQEENSLRAVRRDIREEAEIAFRRLISLEAQLIRREAVEDSQRLYFEVISNEFEFGLGTLPDLVDARLAYEHAMMQVVGARHEVLRQKLDLMRLTARIPRG